MMFAFRFGVLSLLLAFGRTGFAAEPGPIRFTDVARSAGVAFRHRAYLTEERHTHLVMGSGVAWIDFDRDGRPDLYCGQGAPWGVTPAAEGDASDRLFRNLGREGFRDVAEPAGVRNLEYAMGLAVGDYDNDGFPDLYVNCFGANRFYTNNGDGTFAESAAELGIEDPRFGASCTWVDLDGDGNLDLFVVNYLKLDPKDYPLCRFKEGGRDLHITCNPRGLSPEYDAVYRNNGDGTFADWSAKAGLTAEPPRQGLGVVAADFDGDRATDVYVANDSVPNQLWINRLGASEAALSEQAVWSGTALSGEGARQAGMGIVAADLDGDERLDLFKTNYFNEPNTFYRNEGDLLFTDVTAATGLAAPSLPRLGFGTNAVDFDNDGWQDLFVANGHVHDRLHEFGRDEPFAQLAQLFRNRRGKRFDDVSNASGDYFRKPVVGRSSAVADFNRDGRSDLAVLHLDGDLSLLRNDSSAGKSLDLLLVGTRANRDGFGATVAVEAGGRRIVRPKVGSDGYLSCGEARLQVGVGEATTCRVAVTWPYGGREVWDRLAVGTPHVLREGEGADGDADGDADGSGSAREGAAP